MSKKIHSKKIDSIEDPIFKTVLPKHDNDYHDWEKKIDENTKLWFTGKIIKNISYPSPSMLTVQGILTNFHFTTKELYLICNPIGHVKRIKSGNNAPKNQPGFIYNKADDTVRGFDSQITLWISQECFNKRSNGVYKVKIFNNVNGVGKIQIPGIKNINDTINIVKYVRNYINSQNFIYHNLHLLIDKIPNKLIKTIYEHIKPIIDIPLRENIYEFGYSRKCMMEVPVGKIINFNNLNNIIDTIYNNQRLNQQQTFVENFKIMQIVEPSLSIAIRKLIYSYGRNPLYDIVWPIAGPSEDNKGQRKCSFLIYNPRYGNDEKKYSTIVFNSIPKDINGNNISSNSDNDTWQYSILLNGSADIRHINFIHRFIWEMLNCYQDYIFYDRSDNIYTSNNIELYKKITEMEESLFK